MGAALRRWGGVLRGRLLHNGHFKLGALLLAAVFWMFVRTDETLITQRTLQAPLNVEGLTPNQTVTGVPERVVVRLSGPSSRVAALNPEGVDAVLDLRGVTGEFEAAVRVFPPQGLGLVGVSPAEVIGTVETRVEKTVPVRAATFGAGSADTFTEVRVSPGVVVVRGAETLVARVTQALVPVDLAAPDAEGTPYAADAQGRPVTSVAVEPGRLTPELVQRPALTTRRVPVLLGPVRVPGAVVQSAALTRDSATVVGPSAVLARLQRVTATPPETPELEPGQYTLNVTLRLPEGVAVLDAPQLLLEVRAPRVAQPGAQ